MSLNWGSMDDEARDAHRITDGMCFDPDAEYEPDPVTLLTLLGFVVGYFGYAIVRYANKMLRGM